MEFINSFDHADFNFDGEDENGYYWENEEDYKWWEEVAKSISYLEE